MNFQAGSVGSIPVIDTSPQQNEVIDKNAKTAVAAVKFDWDAYETSWDFTVFPLLAPANHQPTLEATYSTLRADWQQMTGEMQRLEEENNRIFIEAYGLRDELTPDVPLNEITLTCNPRYRYGGNKNEEELESLLQSDTIKELISYAIGCMMGRYSLDRPGLIYAHGGNKDFDKIYYQAQSLLVPGLCPGTHGHGSAMNGGGASDTAFRGGATERAKSQRSLRLRGEFKPDDDGIVPVMDQDWFTDDAANRFVEFLKKAWRAPEQLDENLKFVADSLKPKNNEAPVDTIRRYMSAGFFKDHLKTYKKRPIYWLFSSGKQKAFECLVYLHRYNESTLSRIRSNYVTPLQGNFSARLEFLQNEKDAAGTASAQRKIQKEIDALRKKQAELSAFDDELRHYADMKISLDLDDGGKGELWQIRKSSCGKQCGDRKRIM